MNKLKSIGQVIFGIVIFLGILFVVYFFIFGAMHIAVKINPILIRITNVLTAVSVFILLPLTIFKKTRPFSAICLYVSSYFFGLSAWFLGLITTYITLGGFWILIGLIFGGVGVVPMGVIGSIIKGEWSLMWNLLYVTALTFGIRIFVFYIIAKEENHSKEDVKQLKVEELVNSTNVSPGSISSLKMPSKKVLTDLELEKAVQNYKLAYLKNNVDSEKFPRVKSLPLDLVVKLIDSLGDEYPDMHVEDLLVILEEELKNKK